MQTSRVADGMLVRQHGLGNQVEICQIGQQRLDQPVEAPIHFLPPLPRVRLIALMQPHRFHRMQHCRGDAWLSPGQCSVQAGEIVLHRAEFLPPGRLIEDGTGPVPLGLSLHGHPRQVRHADGHAQRRLPVPLKLEGLEVAVPLGHAVQFADHALPTHLMGHTGGLLGGEELPLIAQHINAGQIHAPVASHAFPQR